jgi:sugar-phosphatase
MLLRHSEIRASCLLFDMDGTLLNSHAPMVRAYTALANCYGRDPARVLRESQGRRTVDTMRALAPPGADIEADARALMERERDDMDGVIEIPGAGAFLRSLPADRWAIVTSADRALALNRIRAAALTMPALLVSAEDVPNGKPSPDGFLLGALGMHVAPDRCVMFEDAPAGIVAGLTAGARV